MYELIKGSFVFSDMICSSELKKLGYFGDYDLIQKLLETTKEHIKNKPNEN